MATVDDLMAYGMPARLADHIALQNLTLAGNLTLSGTVNLSGTPQIGGTSILASAAEINRTCDNSTRIVNATASSLAITQAAHDGKIITMNRAGGIAVTMPEATGSGMRIRFKWGTKFTTNGTITLADLVNTDLVGGALIRDSNLATANLMFTPAATEDLITLDGTNKGGGLGCEIEMIDIALDLWSFKMVEYVGGTAPATPFSSSA